MRAARTRLTAALVAGGTTAALVMAPMTGASAAAATLTINVGSGASVHGVVLEGMRFDAPDTISVHRGDVLTFNFQGFHTANYVAAGVAAAGAVMALALLPAQPTTRDHDAPDLDAPLDQQETLAA